VANKTIQLLDFRNCAPGGLDDMGASAAGRWDDVPVVSGDATTAGSILGEPLHQLLKAELPTDKPTGTISNTTITVSLPNGYAVSNGGNGDIPAGGGGDVLKGRTVNPTFNVTQPTSTFTGDPLGSGTKMNVVQRTVLGSWYRKL
jgi:hypothetical protein